MRLGRSNLISLGTVFIISFLLVTSNAKKSSKKSGGVSAKNTTTVEPISSSSSSSKSPNKQPVFVSSVTVTPTSASSSPSSSAKPNGKGGSKKQTTPKGHGSVTILNDESKNGSKSSSKKGKGGSGKKKGTTLSPPPDTLHPGDTPISYLPPQNLRTRESFGLVMNSQDPGIVDSNWVGIENGPAGGDQLERGGLYTGGNSDMVTDFSHVYEEPLQNTVTYRAMTTPSASVELGTLIPNDLPHGRVDVLERRIIELEKMMQTVSRNIEVMQQNTQVISKGFNILSIRVNKVSADHETIHTHMGEGYKVIDEKMENVNKNLTKRLSEFEIQTKQELENLRKTDKDLLESQVATGERHKESMDKLVLDITTWKKEADNETEILAGMVKALAEISKTEKDKMARFENMTATATSEVERLEDTFKKFQVEHASNFEAFGAQSKQFKNELYEMNKTQSDSAELVKTAMTSLSQHFETQIKRLDEGILEQNMAHNMAHENIAHRLDELAKEAAIKAQSLQRTANLDEISDDILNRLIMTEANITTLFSANRQFLNQVRSLEDSDLSIMSRIAELRNVHRNDNSTLRNDLERLHLRVKAVEEESNETEIKVSLLKKQLEADKAVELGGMAMSEPSRAPVLRPPVDESQLADLDINDVRDRFGTIEENVAELWRSQKDLKSQHESFAGLIKQFQNDYRKEHDESSHQLMEVKIATKMLTDVVRNNSKSIFEMEKRTAMSQGITVNSPILTTTNGSSTPTIARAHLPPGVSRNSLENLQMEMRTAQENIASLWENNRNVSKAQEFFLLKLLEMDLEHKLDNKTVSQTLFALSNRTEDFFMQISRADDRINKVVQQFEITDAAQYNIREELLNIKDRLASSEENYSSLWKSIKKTQNELDEIANNVENIILIHKSEYKTMSGELAQSTEKVSNLSKTTQGLNDRVSNIELVMDMEVSGDSSSSELAKLKARLQGSEKDISELWKSTEIMSFQQQVLNEHFKELKSVHENETQFAITDWTKTRARVVNLLETVGNLTERVSTVEKCTSPPYETRTIDLVIPQFLASLESGLKGHHVNYDVGQLVGVPSLWKAFVELNSNQISIFNTLKKAEFPVYNEFEAELLDKDGKRFASYGPDLNLYRANNEKIGWTNVISVSTVEKHAEELLGTNGTLRLRFKIKLYPKVEKKQSEMDGPSEKQLILWEIPDILERLTNEESLAALENDNQAFVDLNVTKEFGAGHFWGGHTLWKLSLLMRQINNQNYIGMNVELAENDGNWKELLASYNVTLLDAHSRMVKEFSIASNDFKSVSARHSYFMLVKDVEKVLQRGDLITFRINFDLKALRSSFDVEVIRR